MSRKKINKALLAAIVLCNHDEVRRLLAAGANIDATDAEHDEPAMVLATRFGDKKLVQLLIDEGAKINARDDRGRTALFFAEVSSEIFAVLIASGTDVHAADHEGNTLLMQKVSESPSVVEVEELLKLGINPAVRNIDGQSALDLATNLGLLNVIERLA